MANLKSGPPTHPVSSQVAQTGNPSLRPMSSTGNQPLVISSNPTASSAHRCQINFSELIRNPCKIHEMPPFSYISQAELYKIPVKVGHRLFRSVPTTNSQVATAANIAKIGWMDSQNGICSARELCSWNCRPHKLPATQGSISITPE